MHPGAFAGPSIKRAVANVVHLYPVELINNLKIHLSKIRQKQKSLKLVTIFGNTLLFFFMRGHSEYVKIFCYV